MAAAVVARVARLSFPVPSSAPLQGDASFPDAGVLLRVASALPLIVANYTILMQLIKLLMYC